MPGSFFQQDFPMMRNKFEIGKKGKQIPMNEYNTQTDISVHSLPWVQQMTQECHHLWNEVIRVRNARWVQKAGQKETVPFLLASAQEHHLQHLHLAAAAVTVPVHVLLLFAAE